jgi:hypothetical protein
VSKQKRTAQSYLASAAKLRPFAPALKKYRRRKTLSPQEKGAISRKEKLLQFHTQHLIPVSKKLARELKNQLFAPGVRAVELRGTSANAKMRRVGKDMLVTSNGRTWLYWRLDREAVKTKKGMSDAAARAFEIDEYEEPEEGEEPPIEQLPIERVAELAGMAFEELKPLAVYLWAPTGRVGDGFASLKQFTTWLAENWQTDRYSQQEKWVNGIAILLNDPNWRKPRSVNKPIKGRDPRLPTPKRKRRKK